MPERGGPPASGPETPPSRYLMSDYSFLLQAIMELQKTVGGLVEVVNTLKTQTGRQGARLDSISHRVYAATVVLMVVVPVLAFLANLFVPLISSVLHLNIPAVPNK